MRTLAITTSAAPRTDFTRKLFHIFYAPISRFLVTEVSIRGIPTMVLLRPTKLLFQLAGDLVWPLPGRANRLLAGLGLGEGAGREYSLIAALIAVAAIASMTTIGASISTTFSAVAGKL